MKHPARIASILLLVSGLAGLGTSSPLPAQERFWRGNLHTHTLWSDGDEYPEMVLDWYKSRGYHFVAISDHNILSQGTGWVHPDQALDSGPAERLRLYRERFGDDWVEIETAAGQRAVRLKTFDEYRRLFDEDGRFLVLQAEEITDSFGDKALHVNATNLVEFIPPQGGDDVVDVLRRNIDAVRAQRERTGRPMLAHLNHPNFRWSITLDEFVAVDNERFFEVYNGHPGVFNDGGPEAPSMDVFWDHALTERLLEGGQVLYGLAVDDAHHWSRWGLGAINAGRGWVMVRAPELSAEALVAALERGDFYASSGVELDEVRTAGRTLELRIHEEEGVRYITHFLGTRLASDGSAIEVGEVLATVEGLEPAYRAPGDVLYVRARVTSSELKENGYRAGELERAWTQPLVLPSR